MVYFDSKMAIPIVTLYCTTLVFVKLVLIGCRLVTRNIQVAERTEHVVTAIFYHRIKHGSFPSCVKEKITGPF